MAQQQKAARRATPSENSGTWKTQASAGHAELRAAASLAVAPRAAVLRAAAPQAAALQAAVPRAAALQTAAPQAVAPLAAAKWMDRMRAETPQLMAPSPRAGSNQLADSRTPSLWTPGVGRWRALRRFQRAAVPCTTTRR